MYTIIGGSGKVAKLFTQQAVQKGIKVKSVVRSHDHVASLKELGASVVVEDIEQASVNTLASVIQGSDVVIWAAGAGGKGGPDRTISVDRDAAIKTYDAVEAAGVPRFLLVSAIDVRDRSKPFPEYYSEKDRQMSERMWKAIPKYLEAKYDADKNLISRTRFNWTILRPSGLTDAPGKGKVSLGQTAMTMVSREDVAATLLALVDEPKSYGMAFDLTEGDTPIADAVQQACARGVTDFTG